jgi:hypothetical protein
MKFRLRKLDIPCKDGGLYLRRWEVSTPWFGVYIHKFVRSDITWAAHDHPWDFVSVMLKGRYTEFFWPGKPWGDPSSRVREGLGAVTYRRAEQAHYVVLPPSREPAWTLILRGRIKREWGFYLQNDPLGWVPHDQFDRGGTIGVEEDRQ